MHLRRKIHSRPDCWPSKHAKRCVDKQSGNLVGKPQVCQRSELRLRSYGRPGAGDAVFVELKKKYQGIVYKRRVEMPLYAAQAWLGGQGAAPDGQIGREIAYTLAQYDGLAPAMFIAYDRVALYDKEDAALRVTFDSRLLFRLLYNLFSIPFRRFL